MKTIILFLLIGFTATSQIDIGIYADGRLLLLGDDKGNDPLTINMVVIPKLHNKEGNSIFVYPLYEYADLEGGTYTRWALGMGWKQEVNKFTIEPSIDYGRILRWDAVYSSFNGLLEFSYSITPKIKICVLNSVTQRQDLKYKWSEETWRYNLYFGAKINVH